MSTQKAQLKQEQLATLRQVIETRMVAPVRALFRGEIGREALAQAHRDLDAIRAALSDIDRAHEHEEAPR
jgi:hypothetical protein